MYIVYNTHIHTHTYTHTKTKSIKGVMIFILKKYKKCCCCYSCLENMRNELRLRDKLTESVACARRNLSKILLRQKFFGAKVSRETVWEGERIMRTVDERGATKENFNNKRNILLNLRFAYEKVYANCARVCLCVRVGVGVGVAHSKTKTTTTTTGNM